MNYPSPCDKCKDKDCCHNFRRCQPWVTRYKYKQKRINAYAKKVLPDYYAGLEKGGANNA